MKRKPILVTILLCMLYAPLSLSASKFDGRWRGTYNSLFLEAPPPDSSHLEKANEFELSLEENKGAITGELVDLGNGRAAGHPITNGKIFGARACFDVLNDYGDMRWCINISGNRLSGFWSRGPEGGRILGGASFGARSFDINGQRISRNGREGQRSHLPN